MIASFNYYGPSTSTFVIGICVAIAILVPLFFTRSVLRGIFGGAISWGLIAVIVFGAGHGDMTDLLQMVWGFICAVAGAVAGLIAGLFGKMTKSPGLPQEQEFETYKRQLFAIDPGYKYSSEAELQKAYALWLHSAQSSKATANTEQMPVDGQPAN